MVERALAAIAEWKEADGGARGGGAVTSVERPLTPALSRSGERTFDWDDIAKRGAASRASRTARRSSARGSSTRRPARPSSSRRRTCSARGAFKFRGAYNKIQAEQERRSFSEVVAYSSGNHAQAVALVSKLLGVKATIVMPNDAPAAKLAATRGYGAEVVLYDRYGGDREEIGERLVRERGALLVPPFDDPLIMAGAGTATAELLEEVPDLDFLLVPVSGGGLIAGSATAAKHLRPADHRLRRRAGDRGRRRAVARERGAGLDPRAPDDRRRPAGRLRRKADFSDRPENRRAAFFSYPTRR